MKIELPEYKPNVAQAGFLLVSVGIALAMSSFAAFIVSAGISCLIYAVVSFIIAQADKD